MHHFYYRSAMLLFLQLNGENKVNSRKWYFSQLLFRLRAWIDEYNAIFFFLIIIIITSKKVLFSVCPVCFQCLLIGNIIIGMDVAILESHRKTDITHSHLSANSIIAALYYQPSPVRCICVVYKHFAMSALLLLLSLALSTPSSISSSSFTKNLYAQVGRKG